MVRRQRLHARLSALLSLAATTVTVACNPAAPGDPISNAGGSHGAASGGGQGGSNLGGRGGAGGSPGSAGSGGAGGSGAGSGGASAGGGTAGSPPPGAGGQAGGGQGGTRADDAGGSTTGGTTGQDDAGTGADAPIPPAGGACPAGTTFCDDFEAQAAGKAPAGKFKVSANAGGLLVDGSLAYSGKQSVAIKVPRGGEPGAFLVFSEQLPLASNDIHGRAMIYLKQSPGQVHWDGIFGSGPGGTYVIGGMYEKFEAVYHPGDCSVDSATPWPIAKWACVQWEFKGGKDGTHVHKMMLNGAVVDNGLTTTMGPANCGQAPAGREWKAPMPFTQLKIGYVHYGSSPNPIEMWIDDLAFGEAEIPCPAPK